MNAASARAVRTAVGAIVLSAGLIAGCAGPAGPDPAGSSGPGPSSSGTASAGLALYDLGGDFSFTANPNGPWRYGYTRGTRLDRTDFTLVAVADGATPVGLWHPGAGRENYYPYIAANVGSTTAVEPTKAWALRPNEVGLEASATGQFSVVEFVAPRAGDYDIRADFAGVHKGLSTTDVHVLRGDESLFAATISGYGGDPAFFTHQGESPTASYHGTQTLSAGDVLTFAVGFGANHTHYNDTTGLIVTVRGPN